jgi:flagellar FliL protein
MSDKKPAKSEEEPPADGEGHGEGEGGAKKRRLPPLMIMIAGGGFALVLVIVLVVYFLFLSGPSAESGKGGEGHGAATEEGHKAEGGHEGGGHEAAPAKEGGGHEGGEGGGHGGEGGEAGSASASPIIEMDDMVVNLATLPGKRASYLKLKVAIEIAKPEERPSVEKQKPRIVDTFQVYLRELRTEDLQGSVGIVRLKEELLSRVTAAIAPIEVRDVLFKELLVQ